MARRRVAALAAAVSVALAGSAFAGCSTDDPDTGSTQTAAGDSGATGKGNASATKDAPQQDDWYTKSFGSFAATRKSGTSDSVVGLPKGAKAGIVKATYRGSSNFVIQALDSSNQPTVDLLVNTIGNYAGTTAYGLSDLGEAAKLKVTAKGAWTLVISPIANAKTLPESGKGDGVYRFDGSATTWKITNKGEGNFVVNQVSDDLIPNLAVNEIGNYKGDVPASSGPSVVTVTSDGVWTIRGGS